MAKGRKSSDRYYATKGAYFTHFEGKQIRLADLAALARFQELMQVSHADTADQGNTVRVVVDLYGLHLERNGQARSLEIVLQTCTSAVEQFGDKTFDVLKPVHVDDWESFVEEWAEGFSPAYDQVTRIGGAGDMGRDVIGHIEPATV